MKKKTKVMISCSALLIVICGIAIGIGNFNSADGVQAKQEVTEVTPSPSPKMCNMAIENADGTVTETIVPYTEVSLNPNKYSISTWDYAADPNDSSINYNREITENTDGSTTYTYTKSANTPDGMESAEELYTTTCPKGVEPDKEITEKYDKLFDSNH